MKILLHNLLKKLKKCVYYIDIGPNPSIALKENPMHSYITGRQKAKKMDIKHLKDVSWRKNVLDNVQILKEANVPREKILELLKQTRKFAKKNNL